MSASESTREARFGLATPAHFVPFQRRMRLRALIAKQLVELAQETPTNDGLTLFEVGTGVGTIFQVVPFQCSANVRSVPGFDAESATPTATHRVAVAHVTSLKEALRC